MIVITPREVACKVRVCGGENFLKKILGGSLNLRLLSARNQCTAMPSQHSPDKEPLSLQIPRTLMGRLKRKAAEMGMTLPGFVIAVLSEKTSSVVLTSHDYQAIAEATRQAEETGRRCATPFDGSTGPQRKARAGRKA